MVSTEMSQLYLTLLNNALKSTHAHLPSMTKLPVLLGGGLQLAYGPAFPTILMKLMGLLCSATIMPSLPLRTTKWGKTTTSLVPWALTTQLAKINVKRFQPIKNLTQLQRTFQTVQLGSILQKEKDLVVLHLLASILQGEWLPHALLINTANLELLAVPTAPLVHTPKEAIIPATLVLLAIPVITQASSQSVP